MSFVKKSFGVVFVLLLMVGMTACSSEGGTYDEVMERGYIEFSMSGGYPPFNYYNDDGELVGFDVEIAEEVANRLNVESKPVTAPFDGLIFGLQTGDFDGILGSMAITEDRKENVSFSNPYYYSGAQIFVREDSDINGIDDITDSHQVAVVIGTTFEDVVAETGAEIVPLEDDAEVLRQLDSGDVDAIVTDYLVGIINIEEQGFDFRPAGEFLYTEEMAVAFRQGDDELVKAVNQALEDMMEDGTYKEISNSYFGTDISEPR
ncbi:transporter substrate-binding domain-containing protein [Proteinivorax hydrogeniformans]|uniref:Transporter substrate-binding domain-containing protein n=1 Tax=Proteinivorax hydrogeniformans TaxID=1826727 RepID=A0AAU8HTQ9_9FIRM